MPEEGQKEESEMPKDTSGYGSGYSTQHQAQHNTRYQQQPEQSPEEAYQAKHDARFAKGLKGVTAQEAYNNKANLLDFKNDHDATDKDKVREILADYVDAFNKTDYASASDRREAAHAVAETTFQPLYKQMEKVEARDDMAIDPALADVLRKEGLKYTVVQKEDGSSELKILFRDRKQAEKIEKLTGVEIDIVERHRGNRDDFDELKKLIKREHRTRRRGEREDDNENFMIGTADLSPEPDRAWGPQETLKMVDFHREMFEQALYDSDRDRALSVEYLTQALVDAQSTSSKWEQHSVTFEAVKDLSHEEALKMTELAQHRSWEKTLDAIQEAHSGDPQAAEQYQYVMDRLLNVYAHTAEHALQSSNGAHYDLCLSHCRETSETLAEAIQNGHGMVKDFTYIPVPIPEDGFESARDAETYLKESRDRLKSMNFGKLHHMYQTSVSSMLDELQEHVTDAKSVQNKRNRSDEEDENLAQALETINGISGAVNRVMAPAA